MLTEASNHNCLPANSTPILDTLENLLAPGGRARLSPYVEAAQLLTLFDVLPQPRERIKATARLVQENEKRIQSLAQAWADFCSCGKSFRNNNYSEESFLDSYLIYYFSVNVAKVQINLLDLLRAGELTSSRFELVDVGVGAGTSAVAVLDFFLAWKTVCDLYDVDFPVETIRVHGMDCSPTALHFAARVLSSYGEALRQRIETLENSSLEVFLDAVVHAEWHEFDLERSQSLPNGITPTLLIASNILNELGPFGQKRLGDLIQELPEGCTGLIIEPGSKHQASFLMDWRKDLLIRGGFARTGPCGQEFLEHPDEVCQGCWNARRQSFHQTALYLAFRNAASQYLSDQRAFDNFENDLLSWSNVWVKRGQIDQADIPAKCDEGNLEGETPGLFRYIGRFWGTSIADPNPDSVDGQGNGRWKEYLKLCHAGHSTKGLVLERPAGFVIPVLRHGQKLSIQNGDFTIRPDGGIIIQVSMSTKLNLEETSTLATAFLSDYTDRTISAIDEAGYRLFGFEKMHPFQHTILGRVLTGRSILGIAATGSGKSECFILPAMLLPGVTVVVSPLVSLMMDQYDQRLTERYGLNHLATYINGQVPFHERQARLRRLEMGYYKLVYFTPEQLERSHVLDTLRRTNQRVGVRYLAMDEAHCISQWGHDFRPSYLNLSRRMKDFGIDPIHIALTATASPYVRKDICEELGLDGRLIDDGGDVYVESSNRPELNLIVRVQPTTVEKVSEIISDLSGLIQENRHNKQPGSAIVFMPITGGHPDSVYPTNEWKAERGKKSSAVTHFAAFLERCLHQRVAIYHSKMDMELEDDTYQKQPWIPGDLRGRRRRSEQQAFIKGEVPIMVATKGFGMGIDKDNVRLIIHRTPPSNLEAYAQEAGRAGRDGNLADVILYYSPDSPEEDNGYGKVHRERSDHEIQSYFLSEKYIRSEDVLVMRAFLKTVPQRLDKSLYFTNDEALGFFNCCTNQPELAGLSAPFSWPAFPPRKNSGSESPDHKAILDLGYNYQSRTNYLDRILQALYRIRPDIPNLGSRCAFLEQVQESEAELVNPQVLQGDAILQSNAYFGQVLREAELSKNELIQLFTNRSLFPIAKRLNLSLVETASLLRDIRFVEGHQVGSRWQPALLDFSKISVPKLGPAARITSLADWRAYAGAFERARKPEAHDRARKAGRKIVPNQSGQGTQQETVIDDWFGEKEVNRPRGWEVFPGSAFHIDDRFDQFFQAFMQLHNQRMENDWASYHRLLGDYVGVEENGEIPRHKKTNSCLRSVLLGYLETYELVSGESCYSCSRCVKDGNYGKYTLEQRRSVVVKMRPSISALFDKLKSADGLLPSPQDVDLLLEYILTEEQAGRSLKGYFSGWSSRLLDQMPDHRPALWLRLEGMAAEILPIQPQEFLQYTYGLLEGLDSPNLTRLDRLIHKAADAFGGDPDYRVLCATLARRLGDHRREASLLHEQIHDLESRSDSESHYIYSATTRLIDLHDSKGPLPDSTQLTTLSLLAGRNAPDRNAGIRWYQPIVRDWDWQEVLNERKLYANRKGDTPAQPALFFAWAEATPDRWRVIGDWFEQNPREFFSWAESDQILCLDQLPVEILGSTRMLGRQVILKSSDSNRIIQVGAQIMRAGENLSTHERKRLTENILQNVEKAKIVLAAFTPTERQALLKHLDSVVEFSNWNTYEIWLSLHSDDLPSGDHGLRLLARGVQLLSPTSDLESEGGRLLSLFDSLISQGVVKEQALKIWLPFAMRDSGAFAHLLTVDDLPDREELKQRFFQSAIRENRIDLLARLPENLADPNLIRIRYFSQAAMRRKSLIKPYSYSNKLSSEDLQAIRDEFHWRKDPYQAEMLASILLYLKQQLNANWKTPLVHLVEALVYAGRLEEANRIYTQTPDLRLYHDGHQLDLRGLIRRVNPTEQNQPLPEVYNQILKAIALS